MAVAPVWDRVAATQGDTSKGFGKGRGFFSVCGKEDGTALAPKPPQGGLQSPDPLHPASHGAEGAHRDPHTACPALQMRGQSWHYPCPLHRGGLPPAKLPCPIARGAPGIPPFCRGNLRAPSQLPCPIARVDTPGIPPSPCRGVPWGPQPHSQG